MGGIDIAIGRIPVENEAEADVVLNKIRSYLSKDNQGAWKSRIVLIGDDGDNERYMKDTEELYDYISTIEPSYNITKILLDSYEEKSTVGGVHRYPQVNSKINNSINQGALIVNYVGHGNDKLLAHEEVITRDEINNVWRNKDKLNLFITASCEFTKFDNDKGFKSAGELAYISPLGGCVAMLTASRVVYASDNFELNKNLFKYILPKQNGTKYSMGTVLMKSKVDMDFSSNVNKRKFLLLGDPSLFLKYPEMKIETNELISLSKNNETIDTLRAFEKIKVKGVVKKNDNTVNSSFNGTVYPIVYDKESTSRTLGNHENEELEYKIQKDIIFKGKSTVKNGAFEFSFIVPKDINYKIAKSKISYYANNDSNDAIGCDTTFYVGGSYDTEITDKEGPDIRLYMNDENFAFGGITNDSPMFIASVSDESGINTMGSSIGHNITLQLDDQNPIEINESYEAKEDKFNEGFVKYKFSNLSEGKHTVKIKNVGCL